ncbi:MarR family winged helix-turn-helix transcriptional regulator [Solimicrobium silvestre]|uniref:Transcriptional regulator n=1 Tax=Solimicrobium silvestre TaxID=2099400 RepID=A0A2S9GTR8_9BURK|nr:MarR family transcriptional regulator [Solimicrobium silvestre]PRC91105.1 Transcriptional regulator [Solimicrobium silvestre]
MNKKNSNIQEPSSISATNAPEISDSAARLEILRKLRIIIRAAAKHSSWIDKQCGVNGAQLWIMQELHEAGALRIGELTLKLAVHQTTTSNLVDGLEKRGYVQKMRDPNDQRAVTVTLTAQGSQMLLAAPKPARGLLPEALMQLDRSSLNVLDQGLLGLLESIDILDEELGMLPLPFTM